MTYSQAEKIFKTARFPERGKPLDKRTRLILYEKDVYAIQHYRTPILKFFPDGTCECDTHGWYSSTTKMRLNHYLDAARIYQYHGMWVMRVGERYFPFVDGIKVKNQRVLHDRTNQSPFEFEQHALAFAQSVFTSDRKDWRVYTNAKFQQSTIDFYSQKTPWAISLLFEDHKIKYRKGSYSHWYNFPLSHAKERALRTYLLGLLDQKYVQYYARETLKGNQGARYWLQQLA